MTDVVLYCREDDRQPRFLSYVLLRHIVGTVLR